MNSDASQAKGCFVGTLHLRQSLRHLCASFGRNIA